MKETMSYNSIVVLFLCNRYKTLVASYHSWSSICANAYTRLPILTAIYQGSYSGWLKRPHLLLSDLIICKEETDLLFDFCNQANKYCELHLVDNVG